MPVSWSSQVVFVSQQDEKPDTRKQKKFQIGRLTLCLLCTDTFRHEIALSYTVRAALALLVLNLSLNTAAFAQSHFEVSTPLSASVADDEALRALTVQYGRALVAGDLN